VMMDATRSMPHARGPAVAALRAPHIFVPLVLTGVSAALVRSCFVQFQDLGGIHAQRSFPMTLAAGDLSARFVSSRTDATRRHRTSSRVKVDGPYGVLDESPAPLVEFRADQDPIWERLAMAVQTADKKRAVDVSAFWVNDGFDIVVVITALSRPQLQAIGLDIEFNMRKKLRLKRMIPGGNSGLGGAVAKSDIREEAASGWVHLKYSRLTINIMTPVQRAYYDIEGGYRDESQDYEEINLEPIMRSDGFGNMRFRGGLPEGSAEERGIGEDEAPTEPSSSLDDDYDADADDPFWA